MNIKRLDSQDSDFKKKLTELLTVEESRDLKLQKSVATIIKNIKTLGDVALVSYTRELDGNEVNSVEQLELGKDILKDSWDALTNEQKYSLEKAKERIKVFHRKQLASSWSYEEPNGTILGQRVTPIEKVGLYVPGGKAAYPSSVLMNAIPAKVAGVQDLIMVVPTPRGVRNDLVLAAAHISGVDRVFTIGGAQAVSALTFGSTRVPKVDKIVGPGNAFVAEAKRQVFGHVGIDMIAGPSEILVLADGRANPAWVAMDLFSQAEHDEMAQALLLSWDDDFIHLVEQNMVRFLSKMPRSDIILQSFKNRSALIKVKDIQEATQITNEIAPEHLELAVEQPRALAEKIFNAGAIFIGKYSSEAFGDYCAGPNHVLPTQGTARFSSPLGVYDFQKRTSLIEISKEGASELGSIAGELARGEGLYAHAQSALMRAKD